MHLRGGRAGDGTPLVSPASTAAMQDPQIDLRHLYTLGDWWGLGWIGFEWDGRRVIGHDGNTIGQSAFLRVLPDEQFAVVLLSNGGYANDLYVELFGEIFRELAGLSMPSPPEPPSDRAPIDGARFVGHYRRASADIDVFEDSGALMVRWTASGTMAELSDDPTRVAELHPWRDDAFLLRLPGEETWSTVTFFRLADGAEYVHFRSRATPKVAA